MLEIDIFTRGDETPCANRELPQAFFYSPSEARVIIF